MGINLPCGNTPLTTNECGGDCDEKIERLAERVSEAEEKLDTIQEGAEVNVNADWDETDPNSDAYIENKPSVNYDLSLGDSAPTVGSAVVGSAILGSLVDIILGRGDGTEDRVSVSGTGAIQITRDGDTMTIHVPVGEIDQLRNGTDTEARAWAANVLKQWLDERIAQIPADQFLDLNKTVFANPFTWSSSTYPGSINPNLDGKPVLVLALTDGENVSYSFLNMEDLIDAYEGVAPISVNGSQISHDNSGVTAGSYGDASNQTPNFGDTFKALRSTVDAKGHVTSMSEHTVKIPDTLATQESAGLMSAEDKEKLDNVDQLYKTTCGNPITIDDADGAVKALNVELIPTQAGTPRQDSTIYNEPYLSKISPAFNSEYDKLVGGTVAWNQLLDTVGKTANGITSTFADGVWSFTGTATNTYTNIGRAADTTGRQGHVVVSLFKVIENPNSVHLSFGYLNNVTDSIISNDAVILKFGTGQTANYGTAGHSIGDVFDGVKVKTYTVDLTQAFGTTVANYIYSLEQATAGAGASFFRKLFPKDYYAYNTGELISVKPTAHVTSQTYPLAGVELRGLFKYVDGKLRCDGDTYESDGTVTRKYVLIDLGTLPWAYEQNYSRFACSTVVGKPATSDTVIGNIICSKYVADAVYHTATGDYDKIIGITDGGRIRIKDTSYTDATTFTQAMSGVMLLCEASTPTTETVTGFTSPQAVGSTESYTDTREVPIPVGHESRYADIFPIYPHTSVSVVDTGRNLADPSIFDINPPSWYTGQYWLGLTANQDGTFTENRPLSWGGYGMVYVGTYKAGTYTVSTRITNLSNVRGGMRLVFMRKQTWNMLEAGLLDNITALGRYSLTKTITEECDAWLVCAPYADNGKDVIFGDIQVELGTATSYAPYTGQTVTVPLNDLYGGTVDVIGGESSEEYTILSTADYDASKYMASSDLVDTNTIRVYLSASQMSKHMKPNATSMITIYSDKLPTYAPDYIYSNDVMGVSENRNLTSNGLWFRINKDLLADQTPAGAKQWLKDNAVTIAYPLATPTQLTTTPTPLTLYEGDNVISTDGDRLCITYLQDRGDLSDLVNEVRNMHKEVQVTLDADEWTETGTQTVMISGLEPDDSVIVTPAPADLITYVNAGVVCISQGTDSLTFQANTPVTVNVNILIAR